MEIAILNKLYGTHFFSNSSKLIAVTNLKLIIEEYFLFLQFQSKSVSLQPKIFFP